MKKKKLGLKIKLILFFSPAIFFMFILLMIVSGGASEQSRALAPPATEEQTYNYQYIGSELGTPWDIVLLADAILADQKGQDSIEEYNPLLTSLEFCILEEREFQWVEKQEETASPDPDAESDQTEEGEETAEPSGEWVYKTTTYYTAKNEILGYLGYNEDTLTYSQTASLVADLNSIAENKSNSEVKYEAVITVNSDFEAVLREYIKLSEENIEKVMELYESKYLVYLYGYEDGTDLNVQLPDLVIGNVTRAQLAQVAASLINYPYLFGGKHPHVGLPVGGLDCSGFVDWVYIQCFGRGVSGALPQGIAASGTAMQFYACTSVTEGELKIGDLGFYSDPAAMRSGQINHVGIYVGKINGKSAFIHCGGRYFGYADRPTGRVGISVNSRGIYNTNNIVTGGTFAPAIPATNFKFFRRPQFKFIEDSQTRDSNLITEQMAA